LKPLLAEQAKENLSAAGGDKTKAPLTNSAKPPSVNTRKQIAKIAGTSEDTVAKVERVLAGSDDKTKAAMLNGTVSINKAAQTVSKKPRKKARKEPSKASVRDARRRRLVIGRMAQTLRKFVSRWPKDEDNPEIQALADHAEGVVRALRRRRP
jgi:hypothetical protein